MTVMLWLQLMLLTRGLSRQRHRVIARVLLRETPSPPAAAAVAVRARPPTVLCVRAQGCR